MQASATAEDDAAQAGSLALQAAMMRKINQLQTTNGDPNRPGGGASAVPSHVPPPLPPNLFACPDKQQVVPGVRPPEARSDLVDLMRVVNDHISAAMGVPASVIFEGARCAPSGLAPRTTDGPAPAAQASSRATP